jgi:hypothetical protein
MILGEAILRGTAQNRRDVCSIDEQNLVRAESRRRPASATLWRGLFCRARQDFRSGRDVGLAKSGFRPIVTRSLPNLSVRHRRSEFQ